MTMYGGRLWILDCRRLLQAGHRFDAASGHQGVCQLPLWALHEQCGHGCLHVQKQQGKHQGLQVRDEVTTNTSSSHRKNSVCCQEDWCLGELQWDHALWAAQAHVMAQLPPHTGPRVCALARCHTSTTGRQRRHTGQELGARACLVPSHRAWVINSRSLTHVVGHIHPAYRHRMAGLLFSGSTASWRSMFVEHALWRQMRPCHTRTRRC